MNREKATYPFASKKKKENLAKNYLARYRVFGAGVYFYACRKRPVINFPKQKARRNRASLPLPLSTKRKSMEGREKRRTKIIGTACTLAFQLCAR